MKYVGVDLHKKVIKLCVIEIVSEKRNIVCRKSFECRDTEGLRAFFAGLGRFRVVVEATAHYEWFFLLIEDLADRLVLAHPKKLRVIAETTRKTDKIDAEILATFLALDMIPEAYRATPRIRQYRVLVRHRCRLQRRITSAKNKLRNKLADYNADIAELFTRQGAAHLAALAMNAADRFEVEAVREQLALFERQLAQAERRLIEFAETAPVAEQEARALLATIPQVGPVTIDVVLSELGEWRRFRGAKRVVAFAGLDPGVRQSASKRLDLHISKEGSRWLRWVLIQAAWRLTGCSPRWAVLYNRVIGNTGSKKKAVVAVARHLLVTMFALLRTSKPYQLNGCEDTRSAPVARAKAPRRKPKKSTSKTSARARQKGAAPSRRLVATAPTAAPESEGRGDGDGGRG